MPAVNRLTLLLCAVVAFTACQELPTGVDGAPPALDVASVPLDHVAHWDFDEGNGNVAADVSGNGNDGTLVNGPTWVPGESGTALSFDGVDDHVLMPDDDALDMVGDFTISLWLKWSNDNIDVDVLRKGSTTTATSWYKIEVSGNEIKAHVKPTGANSIVLFDTQTRKDGDWHHVVFLREGSSIRLYVDSLLVDSRGGAAAASGSGWV